MYHMLDNNAMTAIDWADKAIEFVMQSKIDL